MATYGTFIAGVRAELEEDYESVWKDASLLRWTNDAIRDFAYRVKFAFDEQYRSSVAEQNNYELPSNTVHVLRVAYDGNHLARERLDAFLSYQLDETESGTPVRYVFEENQLYLHPTPDTTADEIVVWRRYVPDDITSTEDDMPWDSEYDNIFAYYVKARAWEQTGDFDSLRMNDDFYERAIQREEWHGLDSSTDNFYYEPTVVW